MEYHLVTSWQVWFLPSSQTILTQWPQEVYYTVSHIMLPMQNKSWSPKLVNKILHDLVSH